MDLMKVPLDPWAQRAHLLGESLPDVIEACRRYIDAEYEQKDLLATARTFLVHDFIDTAPSDIESLTRVWYFPWIEASAELDLALTHTMLGMHRATYDHQRRGLELVVVGSLFVAETTSATEGSRWMASALETPMFTRAIDRLGALDFYQAFDDDTGWIRHLKRHYWAVCDIIHVKGTACGLREVQPSSLNFNGMSVPEFNGDAVKRSLDFFLDTVGHTAVALALSNPVLLYGLPLDEKFGLNGPLSGFFTDDQTDRLLSLIPDKYADALLVRSASLPEVESVRDWIQSLPDLSPEEIRRQAAEQSWHIDEDA